MKKPKLIKHASNNPDHVFELSHPEYAQSLFGENDGNLKLIEKTFNVDILPRGTQLHFQGNPQNIKKSIDTLSQLQAVLVKQKKLSQKDIDMLIRGAQHGQDTQIKDYYDHSLGQNKLNQAITPKTENQKTYIDTLQKSDIVFAWGPAGTGKTYLAMAMAVAALQKRLVKKIILTRPAVEAGEKLGFLPGDLAEKVNPYLRPLLDALHDMVETERAFSLIERGIIEVAPLAFMRGRTLNNAFVILDEAQNTTAAQMKMFLTRLGFGSKAVITGDVTQIDLPRGDASGLVEALDILKNVPGIGFAKLDRKDVVRNPLVQKIVEAYELNT
ncbi:PhoH family protein [bacterium]|nr:PhoH family protein [bacterium]